MVLVAYGMEAREFPFTRFTLIHIVLFWVLRSLANQTTAIFSVPQALKKNYFFYKVQSSTVTEINKYIKKNIKKHTKKKNPLPTHPVCFSQCIKKLNIERRNK